MARTPIPNLECVLSLPTTVIKPRPIEEVVTDPTAVTRLLNAGFLTDSAVRKHLAEGKAVREIPGIGPKLAPVIEEAVAVKEEFNCDLAVTVPILTTQMCQCVNELRAKDQVITFHSMSITRDKKLVLRWFVGLHGKDATRIAAHINTAFGNRRPFHKLSIHVPIWYGDLNQYEVEAES